MSKQTCGLFNLVWHISGEDTPNKHSLLVYFTHTHIQISLEAQTEGEPSIICQESDIHLLGHIHHYLPNYYPMQRERRQATWEKLPLICEDTHTHTHSHTHTHIHTHANTWPEVLKSKQMLVEASSDSLWMWHHVQNNLRMGCHSVFPSMNSWLIHPVCGWMHFLVSPQRPSQENCQQVTIMTKHNNRNTDPGSATCTLRRLLNEDFQLAFLRFKALFVQPWLWLYAKQPLLIKAVSLSKQMSHFLHLLLVSSLHCRAVRLIYLMISHPATTKNLILSISFTLHDNMCVWDPAVIHVRHTWTEEQASKRWSRKCERNVISESVSCFNH